MSFSLDSTLAPSLRLELSDTTLASNLGARVELTHSSPDSTLATTYTKYTTYLNTCTLQVHMILMSFISCFCIQNLAHILKCRDALWYFYNYSDRESSWIQNYSGIVYEELIIFCFNFKETAACSMSKILLTT